MRGEGGGFDTGVNFDVGITLGLGVAAYAVDGRVFGDLGEGLGAL